MSNGKFVWHDLMSTDVEGSKRFYGELFGWRIKRDEHGPYNVIFAGDRDIGGILPFDRTHGIPSHWIGYVAVDDVDAATSRAAAAGGRVHVPKQHIPEVGWFAVIGDPEGPLTAPYRRERAPAARKDEVPAPSTFCWDELLASDPEVAADFYGKVYGWRVHPVEMGGFGTYTLLLTDEKDAAGNAIRAGGMMKMPPGVPRPLWLSYVAVERADEAIARAKQLGAMITSPPMDIPNVGRFATMLDPQGAPIAILQPPRQ